MNPASLFFSSLFSSYPPSVCDDEFGAPSLTLEIRPLLPEWKKFEMLPDEVDQVHRDARKWFCLQPEYIQKAADYALLYSDLFDVYFGVLPRYGRTGNQANVPFAASLFCDVDGGDDGIPGAIQRIKDAPIPKPDIAIQSGGGVHSYWLLNEPVPLPDQSARESFKKTLRRLCNVIGGRSPSAHADLSACEVARILRVPGTWNHKQKDNPRPVKILRSGAAVPRSYDWWRSQLPQEPEPSPKAVAPHKFTTGKVTDGLKSWAMRGYPEGNRHKDLAGAAAWLIRDCGLTKDDAEALLAIKAANSPGRRAIPEREVKELVKWA